MTTKPITIVTVPPEPTRVPDPFAEARKLAGKIRKIDEKVKRQIAAADEAKLALLNEASFTVRQLVEIVIHGGTIAADAPATMDPSLSQQPGYLDRIG
jgi:hypothetical protein